MESGIHGVESRIQVCLGFPYMGRLQAFFQPPRVPRVLSRRDYATNLLCDKHVSKISLHLFT